MRRLFAERGYVGTTMRAIAGEAGVDVALIVHFFGSKAGLLTATLRWPFDPEVEMVRVTARGRRHAGEELARLVVRTWDRDRDRDAIMTLLRAAMIEPAAAKLLREFMLHEFKPLMRQLRSDQADLRADLAVSQIVGLGNRRATRLRQPLRGRPRTRLWPGSRRRSSATSLAAPGARSLSRRARDGPARCAS